MLSQRDKLLVGGGLLIGIGAGSCIGLCLFVASIFFFLHHMFIVGVRPLGVSVLGLVPLLFILCGTAILMRGRRSQ